MKYEIDAKIQVINAKDRMKVIKALYPENFKEHPEYLKCKRDIRYFGRYMGN